MNEFTRKLWPAFQAESSEQIEALELALLRETAPDIHDLFRYFHTLKGGCAMMGFAGMESVAHACEDLLDGVRRGERVLDAALTEALLAAIDGLKTQLARAEADDPDPAAAPALLARLRALAPAAPATAAATAPVIPSVPASSPQRDALLQELRMQLPALCRAVLQQESLPPAALAALQQAAGVCAAGVLDELRQQLTAAADAAARRRVLTDLMQRLCHLATESGMPELVAEAAAQLRAASETEFRATAEEAARAVAALCRGATLDAAVLAPATALVATLADEAALLCLTHTQAVLRFARQALREIGRGGADPRPDLLELLAVAAGLPGELLPGLDEDAPYVAMCTQLLEALQHAATGATRGDADSRAAALAARLALTPALLATLDTAALARLEAALARGDSIVEIDTDPETAPDRGRAFMDWLSTQQALLGSCTADTQGRLVFLAALPLPVPEIRRELDVRGLTAKLQDCRQPRTAEALADAPEKHEPRENADSGEVRPAAGGLLRVDSSAVDAFVNRIGEMVTLRNTLAHVLHRDDLAARSRRAGLLLRDRDAGHALSDAELQELREVLAALSAQREELLQADLRLQANLARLQEGALGLRVVPIAQVLNRLPRAVHDLAQQLDRQMKLEIAGEEVRIDKGMVDVLVEPLMHLVRNAVDHGLEPAAERVAAGKPAQGCLRVTARQQSNTLLLEIADDGRGLDSARLRDRALALGLLDAAAAAAQGERELQQLIFLPGFSTAPRVSGVSGRGVGMDAVKASVTRMGGQIELASTPGQGTVFTLHLPLSAAIQNVVLVAAGTRQFAVPERNVAEVVSLPAAALQTVQGQACCLLRGVTLPLYRLAELLGDAGGSDASSRLEVVVITDGVHRIGLVVGQVLGRPEVYLRELHPDLARLPGVGGASILGDGRVVIIVDCEKLFALALRRAQSLRSLVRLS